MHRVATFIALMGALSTANLAFAGASEAVPAATAHDYRDAHFDYFVSGDPLAPRATKTDFGLVLMGGGGRLVAAFKAIAARAGGGHLLILRAVSDDSFDPDDGDYGRSFAAEWGPVASAETIVFHDRAASFDPRVIAALERADGIFLAGGDQANYVRYWKGTPVQRLLNEHVAANRPIGGSSAGLAILGRYSYTAFDGGSMESKVALHDPFDSGMTLESDFLHCRNLERVLTDTHFSARRRLGRLIAFLARLNADGSQAGVYGIGVDEHTALLVDSTGTGRVLDGSEGSAFIVSLPAHAPAPARGKPLSLAGVRVLRLDRRGSLDTRSGAVTAPAEVATINLVAGKALEDSFAARILRRETVPAGED